MFKEYLTPKGRLSCKQPQYIKNSWYISKFREIHGDKYDYSQVNYVTQHVKVEINCRIHGVFQQSPQNHLAGSGCPKCGKLDTLEDFIEKSKRVHGSTYDYSETVYQGSTQFVNIRCKIHGVFEQRANCHVAGQGCPDCANQNPSILYVLGCKNTGLVKVGITSNIDKRLKALGGNLSVIFQQEVPNVRKAEKLIHHKYAQYRTINTTVRSGNTEFFNLSEGQVAELQHFIISLKAGYLL